MMGTPPVRQHIIFESQFEIASLSDWSLIESCNPINISTSTVTKFSGNSSGHFISNLSDTSVCLEARSQVLYNDVVSTNFERWYGFAFYLNDTYPANYEGVESIFEFFRTDTVDLYPPFMLNYQGYEPGYLPETTQWKPGTYLTTNRFTRMSPPSTPYMWYINPVGPINKNQWNVAVIHIKWSGDTSGRINVWVNDTLFYNYGGPTTYGPVQLRLGIDNWNWRLKWGNYLSNKRELFIDEFRIGDELATYLDVRPGTTTTPPPPPPPPTSPSFVRVFNILGQLVFADRVTNLVNFKRSLMGRFPSGVYIFRYDTGYSEKIFLH